MKLGKHSQNRLALTEKKVPHYGIRKLTIGAASVLLGTALYLAGAATAHADTVTSENYVFKENVNNGADSDSAEKTTATNNTAQANADNSKRQTGKNQTKSSTTPAVTAATSQSSRESDAPANEASNTTSSLKMDDHPNKVINSSSGAKFSWMLTNIDENNTYYLDIPKDDWFGDTLYTPSISNTVGTLDSRTLKDANKKIIGYRLIFSPTSSNTGTVTIPFSFNGVSSFLDDVKNGINVTDITSVNKKIQAYQIDQNNNQTLIGIFNYQDEFKSTPKVTFDRSTGLSTKVNSPTQIRFNLSNGFDTSKFYQVLNKAKITVNVPANFKLTQAQLKGQEGTKNMIFTQAKAGDPVIVTIPDGYQLYGSNGTFSNEINSLLLIGEYELAVPTISVTVSSNGGTFEYTINGQAGNVSVPTYSQTIEPNKEKPYVGKDFKVDVSQNKRFYYKNKKINQWLAQNYFASNMSLDNNNLDHLSQYHDLTFTTQLSDGQQISKIEGFDSHLIGVTVHLTYQDGSTQDVKVNSDESIVLNSDKDLKIIEFCLKGQLPQDFNNTLNFYGNISSNYLKNNVDNEHNHIVSNTMTVTMPNRILASKTDSAEVEDASMQLNLQVTTRSQINDSNFIMISANNMSYGLLANGKLIDQGYNLSTATVDKVSHPQFWFVLPEPADGQYSYNYEVKNSPWKVDVSRVGTQYVVHAQIAGDVSIADFTNDLPQLPQNFSSGENFINHLYNDGHVYFTADNASEMNLVNSKASNLSYAGMEGKSIYNIADFSGQTQTAKAVLGKIKVANNQDKDVYSSSSTILYQGNNELSLQVTLNNATPEDQDNFYTIINVPKLVGKNNFAINLVKNGIQVINAVNNQPITGVRILVSTKPAELQSTTQPNLSSYVDPATVSDWSTIQSIYVEIPKVASNEIDWVIVKGCDTSDDLVEDIGKSAVVEGMFGSNSMKPTILSGQHAARLKISNNVTIHQRLHYVDQQGQDHYVNLNDVNSSIGRSYNLLDPNNVSQVIPTGYQIKYNAEGNWDHSVVNGAKTWQSDEANDTFDLSSPITYYADDDTVQYELEPATAAQIKVQYVDTTDPFNYKVLKTITVDGYGNTALSDEDKATISSPYQSYAKQGYHYDTDFTTMVTNGVADQDNKYYQFKTNQDAEGNDGIDLSTVKYAVDGTTPVYIIPINQFQNTDPHWTPQFSNISLAYSIAPVNGETMDLSQIDSIYLGALDSLFQFSNLRQLPNGNYVLAVPADTIEQLNQNSTQYGIQYRLTQENGILTISMDLSNLNYGYNVVTGDSDNPADFTPWYYYNTGKQDENGKDIWQSSGSQWVGGASHTLNINLNQLMNFEKSLDAAQNNGSDFDVNSTIVPDDIFTFDGKAVSGHTVSDYENTTYDPDSSLESGPINFAYRYGQPVSQDIVRTINVTTPDGKTKTIKQTATLTRKAIKDENGTVTGFTPWSTDNWDVYTVPAIAGYTPSQATVAAVVVKDGQKDVKVDITYTANAADTGSQTINYVDKNGKVIGKQVIKGRVDQTVKLTPQVPAGWKLAGSIPATVTINSSDEPINVLIEKIETPNKKHKKQNQTKHNHGKHAAKAKTTHSNVSRIHSNSLKWVTFVHAQKPAAVQAAKTETQAKTKALPQTGTNLANVAALLGLNLSMISMLTLFGTRKRKDK